VALARRRRQRVGGGVDRAGISAVPSAVPGAPVDRARVAASVTANGVAGRGRAAAAAGDRSDRASENQPSRSRRAQLQACPLPSKSPKTNAVLICARDGGIRREAALATFRINPPRTRVLTAASYVVLRS